MKFSYFVDLYKLCILIKNSKYLNIELIWYGKGNVIKYLKVKLIETLLKLNLIRL